MEDFSAIATFVRVVEAKSFSAAAQQLGMTPSGVSRAISRLEEQVNARLLFRTTRTLKPTEEGTLFYARCKDILADLTEAKESLSSARSLPSGNLRVAVPTSIGRSALIPNFAAFGALYPDIRLELSMRDYVFDLNEEGFDCAIRIGELEDSSLIARKLGYFNNALFASPEYLQRHGRPTRIDELKQHKLINYVDAMSGRPLQWQFDTPGGRVALDIDAHMLINDGESVLQAAAAGLGIIHAPYCLAAHLLNEGRLEPVMTDTSFLGSPVWILYPQKRHLSARVQAFIEWTASLFSVTCEPMRKRIEAADAQALAALKASRRAVAQVD